jgi:Na+-transporting NADH:ubiquinone oxidoreductase subunit NqrF
MLCQVTILPGEIVFHARQGAPLRELLLQEGILLDFPCGGRGLCGQCAVEIQPPTESGQGGRKKLPEEALVRGLRLACQVQIEGDCTVRIPEEKGI